MADSERDDNSRVHEPPPRAADEEDLAIPDDDDTETVRGGHADDHDPREDGGDDGEELQDIATIVAEERRRGSLTPEDVAGGGVAGRYRDLMKAQAGENSVSNAASGSAGSADAGADAGAVAPRSASPLDSLSGIPDGSPSPMHGSVVSSPGSSVLPSVASRAGLSSPTPFFRPFDRRFHSRLASSTSFSSLTATGASSSSRPSSPAFPHPHHDGHGRNLSVGSQQLDRLDGGDAQNEASSPPWEVVRWTKLKKLTAQVFSEAGRRSFGTPTCLAVSGSIVLGTSKGIILMFDYGQNLKAIIGPGTKAVECGAVTSVAISADHTTVGAGHANGSIFTWEASRAAAAVSKPFLHIPNLEPPQLANRTADGHVPGAAVTHLGFLGSRRTALVSADDGGMAFAHLATRGTGALGRTVKTARILGRYPDSTPPPGKTLKPSTVLAFAPLPLAGNVDRATDSMGLTAMLTPYLLVIVSTAPVAQTQHKSARPRDVALHGAMTACLAWFPAVRLKQAAGHAPPEISRAKLVYCWSDVLTVLDVDEMPSEDKDKPPILNFKARSRWKCGEAIVAVQWIDRSVITLLTITRRLVVLEDHTMRVTDGFDLLSKHTFHADLFSKKLQSLVEHLDEDDDGDASMHGVVADAFYMSFKAYKGRIFLLGFADVSVGALTNWHDRLVALAEHGDHVGAVRLATSYFTGDADKLTVGLPEDAAVRHAMVRDKLTEIMAASLEHAFGQRGGAARGRAAADAGNDETGGDERLRELTETCFAACKSADRPDFLFGEMWERYEEAEPGAAGIFLETLEPYVLGRAVETVPPAVVKAMVAHYVARGWEGRLEEMVCHMQTATLDLDQITQLCRQHGLYDALIYVWNQALGDYVTPMIDLLALLVPSTEDLHDDRHSVNALKIFPYLSYTLTGRIYPTGEPLADEASFRAKSELYWFLFSGSTVTWPGRGGKPFLTRPREAASEPEPSFPYLRLVLRFDAPGFLSALNEAFEDPFLNSGPSERPAGSGEMPEEEEQQFGLTVDRQYIVSILLDVMNPDDFAREDAVYLDMFIARNLPKFPQYLLLPGSALTRVLAGLCNYPGEDLAEDAQLSAEYLLSVYHPHDPAALVPLFARAGFYRILKRIYRAEKQFGRLVETYFEDPDDRGAVFACLADCLRPHAAGPAPRQVHQVVAVVREHARELLEIDAAATAATLASQPAELHRHVLASADGLPELQYRYLQALLEPEDASGRPAAPPDRELLEQYVRLMCRTDPGRVSDYLGTVPSADLRLDRLLPAMEESGVVDAAVVLMAREGQVRDAMDRLVRHLGTLESAAAGLLAEVEAEAEDGEVVRDRQGPAEEVLLGLQKYVHVAIWLCRGRTRAGGGGSTAVEGTAPASVASPEALPPDEELWLSLIDAAVQVTRRLSTAITAAAAASAGGGGRRPDGSGRKLDEEKLIGMLRSLVQHTFTSLLACTSGPAPSSHHPPTPPAIAGGPFFSSPSPATPPPAPHTSLSFLRILRAFLTRAAAESPTLADLRSVLQSIFSAYAYEESILRLSTRLLERSLFVGVSKAAALRQRGWRPRGSTCEGCGGRVWGPGVAGNVYEAWEEKRALVRAARSEGESEGGGKGKGKGKGKAKGPAVVAGGSSTAIPSDPAGKDRDQLLGPLVLLACRHIYHQRCLATLQGSSAGDGTEHQGGSGIAGMRGEREYRCPIDG